MTDSIEKAKLWMSDCRQSNDDDDDDDGGGGETGDECYLIVVVIVVFTCAFVFSLVISST